ncbi:Uncharacterised protein [Serratia quinivorans]|uniref:DUF6338 family protein n=1 Tax=Serratia quinivorans TaxID=137545 RepID=UPI002179E127|nr:DUF6338 family protein [Serratia quinivorans]CAI1502715.1 Uncharacterised protein [Serratia quinivorans]
MESISSEIFDILKFLLPGFLTAWIFHALTSHPKQAQFERIVQALIFTVIAQGLSTFVKPVLLWLGKFHSFGIWTNTTQLVWSYIAAIIVGLVFSAFANNDLLHKLFRLLRITKETSYPSEWFGTFHCNEWFVIVHLNDERRVFGWPHEWSSDPTKGHVVLMNPSWVTEDGYVDMNTVGLMLLNVTDIKWVEFLQETPGVDYVEESTDTTTLPTN